VTAVSPEPQVAKVSGNRAFGQHGRPTTEHAFTCETPRKNVVEKACPSAPARAESSAKISEALMKLIPRQKLWLTIVVLGNTLLWAIPSNVIELIARDEHVLLGRYSREHLTLNLVVLVLSAISLWIDAAVGERYRRRWFAVIAAALATGPVVLAVDFLLRRGGQAHYVQETLAYHRPPGFQLAASSHIVQADLEEGALGVVFRDEPQAVRSFPRRAAGYPELPIRYQADARGYRNATALEQCDIVVIGDSFAEGAKVSDGQEWPAKLADVLQQPVYNLGMSGYAPVNYRAALVETGLALRPRLVLVMVYEGNDFRSAKADAKAMKPSVSARIKRYVKQSPLLQALDRTIIDTFGALRADRPLGSQPAIDWLPVAVAPSDGAGDQGAVCYAFEPKQVIALLATSTSFAQDKHWLAPREHLADMDRLCREQGARLVVVYAPLKANVVLPLVMDHVAPESLHAFVALREDELPPPAALVAHLRESIGGMEAVVRDWCLDRDIPFVSLTAPLREHTASGRRQTYFTYDQHWTPDGHFIAADAIARALREMDLLPRGQADLVSAEGLPNP
jgi:hypothetical protein